MKSTTMKRKKHPTSDEFFFIFISFSQWLSNWPGLVFFAIISRWRMAIVCVCFYGLHAVLFLLPLFLNC